MTNSTFYNYRGTSTTRTWHDGFGMPVQTVTTSAEADAQQDVATFTEYDALDRPVRRWQPVPASGTDCIYTVDELRSLASSVYGSDSRPYTSCKYRVSSDPNAFAVYAPGDALADYPARTEYLCNNTTDPELKVKRIKLYPANNSYAIMGFYPAATLDAVRSTDPDGHEMTVFTDWRGFKILERRKLSATDFLDTYYLNDAWGNPLVVIQPEKSAVFSSFGASLLNTDSAYKYTFQYSYDRCGRIVSKKIPGCEPVAYRYDPYGRLAFMQDGNMRAEGRAMFTFYDGDSRIVVTGMCKDDFMSPSAAVPPMTAVLDENASGICGTGYLSILNPYLRNPELLTATYYDNYDFLGLEAFSDVPTVSSGSYAPAGGLVTGTLTAVLGSDSSTAPIASVTFYDSEERPVRTFSTTHLPDTYEETETTYTLDGQPKTVSHTLTKGDETYTDSYEYTYDNVGRLDKVMASFPGLEEEICICENRYSFIGLLSRTFSDSMMTDYGYDIRGAVRSIASGENLLQYIDYNANGTISSMQDNWVDISITYDGAGRLVSYKRRNGGSLGGEFSSTYTYDHNSNITSLTRSGYPTGQILRSSLVDDLAMTYEGNRLVKVTDNADEVLVERSFDFYDGADNATEYAYDSNGNVIRDDNRGIRLIEYNVLGLPSYIENERTVIDYIYDAAGNKLGSRARLPYGDYCPADDPDLIWRPENRDYFGNYEFYNDELLRVNTPYGYWAWGNFVTYERDYQGNNRNRASYYAYGLPVYKSEVGDPDRYLYSGKEFEMLKGLNLYDFAARTYAPDLARFMQPDPLAGDYHWLSPYILCGADPINYIDPTGQTLSAISNGITYTWKYTDSNGWGFYDAEGMLYKGDDVFMLELVASLQCLLTGSTGEALVKDIVNSERIVELKNGTGIGTGANDKFNKIYIDYEDPAGAPTTKGMDFDPTMNLAHELAHAQLGKEFNQIWFLKVDDSDKIIWGVDASELYATHFENKIRAEHNFPLRTHYRYRKGIISGRIIDKTGKYSLYYDINENLMFPETKSKFVPFKY